MRQNKLKLQVPIGTGDYLPDECAKKRKIERILQSEYKKSGYSEIQTPSFEYYDVFMCESIPYVQEHMIKFFDRNGRILALRPDMTGPIARMAATRLLQEKSVLRLCYNANAYGLKREGVRSEYTQSGVELLGKSGAKADAEVIALAISALKATGLTDFQIDIGQVAYFKGLIADTEIEEEQADHIRMLIDAKNNIDLEYELSRLNIQKSVKKALLELPGLFGGIEVLERATAENEICKGAVKNIRKVYDILCDYGYGDYISIDFGLLNDFNYYSGILFRGIVQGIGMPVLSGGRYDELLTEFGKSCPATGFAIGIRELLTVLEKNNALTCDKEKTIVLKCTKKTRKKAYENACQMRSEGKCVIVEEDDSAYNENEYETIYIN